MYVGTSGEGVELNHVHAKRSWFGAAVAGASMVILSFVAFVYAPNTLLGYLTTRVLPVWRDLIVVVVWMASFGGCCWVFVRLQRRRSA